METKSFFKNHADAIAIVSVNIALIGIMTYLFFWV
jgi:hypothetical protein